MTMMKKNCKQHAMFEFETKLFKQSCIYIIVLYQ